MRKLLGVLLLLLVGLVVAMATDRPLPRADLTVIDFVDFNTLDPQRMSYMHDNRLSYSIYEGLVKWDIFSDDFRIIPAGARSWEISPDGLVYTFHLEPDARWSNGDPVTAHDFAYSWQRALMPETVADYVGFFFRIKGARAFYDWRREQLDAYAARPASKKSVAAAQELRRQADERFRDTVGIEAVDDHTLRVTLERPTPFFIDLVAFSCFSPVCRNVVDSPRWTRANPETGAIEQDQGWTKPPHLITNGPYIVESWRFKREMRLAINPYYWNPGKIKSRTVAIIPIEDQNTGVLAFHSGAADIHINTDVNYIPEMLELIRKGEIDFFHDNSTFGTYFWSFNCTPTLASGQPNPFSDPRVRRAFALAIDKKAIAEKVMRTGVRVADVLIPPDSIAGFRGQQGLSHDPGRARRELAAAGWIDRDGNGIPENERGDEFPAVELLITQVPYHRDVAIAMGRMWKEVLGIRSSPVVRETKVYAANLDRRDYMMARGGWFGDFGDPMTFLELHRTGDGNNDRGFTNAAFDALLDAAEDELDPEKRMRILEEAERLTMEDELPIMPLWNYKHFYLFKPPEKPDGSPNPGGVRGVSRHPRLVQYYWAMEVVR